MLTRSEQRRSLEQPVTAYRIAPYRIEEMGGSIFFDKVRERNLSPLPSRVNPKSSLRARSIHFSKRAGLNRRTRIESRNIFQFLPARKRKCSSATFASSSRPAGRPAGHLETHKKANKSSLPRTFELLNYTRAACKLLFDEKLS